MKQVVVLGVLIVAGAIGAYLYLNNEGTKERGEIIGYAFGETEFDGYELHILVSMAMARQQPPGPGGPATWDEWMDLHFRVTDDAGKEVSLRRSGASSSLIPDAVAGNPDSILKASIEPGRTYTIAYQKYVEDDVHYTHSFEAIPEGQPIQRPYFERQAGAM